MTIPLRRLYQTPSCCGYTSRRVSSASPKATNDEKTIRRALAATRLIGAGNLRAQTESRRNSPVELIRDETVSLSAGMHRVPE